MCSLHQDAASSSVLRHLVTHWLTSTREVALHGHSSLPRHEVEAVRIVPRRIGSPLNQRTLQGSQTIAVDRPHDQHKQSLPLHDQQQPSHPFRQSRKRNKPYQTSLTPQERSTRARAAVAARNSKYSAEQRKAWARKGGRPKKGTGTPEQRRQQRLNREHDRRSAKGPKLTHEERSARWRGSTLTRVARYSPELRSEWSRRGGRTVRFREERERWKQRSASSHLPTAPKGRRATSEGEKHGSSGESSGTPLENDGLSEIDFLARYFPSVD